MFFLFLHENMWVLIRGASHEYPQYAFVEKQEKYQYFLAEKNVPYLLVLNWT